MNENNRVEPFTHTDRYGYEFSATSLVGRFDPWNQSRFIFTQKEFDTAWNVADAIRLRDWLSQVIDAAGPRPLHPHVQGWASAVKDPIFAAWAIETSDRLYELDERRAREGQ